MSNRRCPCGLDHQPTPAVASYIARLIATKGDTIRVKLSEFQEWHVPRVWISFHGLKASELPTLAARYGWPRVTR